VRYLWYLRDTFHVSNFRRYDYFRGFGKTVLHSKSIKAKSLACAARCREPENWVERVLYNWKTHKVPFERFFIGSSLLRSSWGCTYRSRDTQNAAAGREIHRKKYEEAIPPSHARISCASRTILGFINYTAKEFINCARIRSNWQQTNRMKKQ